MTKTLAAEIAALTRKQYREYLNELFPANAPYPHSHNRYKQRARAYGDYLYYQDREKFEADYQEELQQRRLKESGQK